MHKSVFLSVFNFCACLCVQEMVRRGEILDDSMEDEFYLRRLDAGLFVLQLICYIMVEISNSGISQVHKDAHTRSGLPNEFSLWLIIVETSDQTGFKKQESDVFFCFFYERCSGSFTLLTLAAQILVFQAPQHFVPAV